MIRKKKKTKRYVRKIFTDNYKYTKMELMGHYNGVRILKNIIKDTVNVQR